MKKGGTHPCPEVEQLNSFMFLGIKELVTDMLRNDCKCLSMQTSHSKFLLTFTEEQKCACDVHSTRQEGSAECV